MIEEISKPKYLKKKNKPLRILISIGLMYLMFCIMNPFLLIISPIYIWYVVKAIKNNKDSENILIDEAIDLYYSKKFEQSLECCNSLDERKDEEQVRLLKALNFFMLGDKKEFAEIILSINNKDLEADADIQIKLGEALEELGELDKANKVYKRLVEVFPKSKYLQEKVASLNS
ncbi:tetratricopeptide repeat protein [Inconstantimicrobium mannanitabidum]|uniref:Uncharacterized protein n=1 Tax=Inconstantimicrobium mannanitabidum TaxID=1604901 RepID=A0ACB5R7D8_9CLOT|nr:tetratricopeptide repeat protein [Clostridium sp. TW13]GKX65100.1 hypothetical protein rsdtw13_03580 [Clostridium sp. TW13]